MMRNLWELGLVTVFVLAAGCAGEATTPSGSEAPVGGGSPGAPTIPEASAEAPSNGQPVAGAHGLEAQVQRSAIRGTWIDSYLGDQGAPVSVPRDLSGGSFSVRVHTSSSGEVETLVGTGSVDGTFSIANVPRGPFILEADLADDGLPPLFLYTSQRKISLGSSVLGRPDRQTITSTDSWIAFEPALEGMTPWADDHQLQLIVSNLGLFAEPFYTSYTNAPAAGATSLGMRWNLAEAWDRYAIDGSRGDTALLTQLVPRANPTGLPHYTIDSFAELDPFTTVGGGSVNATGSFSQVAQSRTMPLNWRRSAFSALASGMGTGAVELEQYLQVRVQPGGVGRGHFTFSTSDLIQMWPGPGTSDLDLGTVAYGDPFPQSWGRIGIAQALFQVPVLAPGATSASAVYPIVEYDAADTSFGADIAPIIATVQNPLLNGASLFAAQTISDLEPTVSWSAPAFGAPSGYGAYLFEASVGPSGNTKIAFKAEMISRGTSIAVPPGLLERGHSYFFMIRTMSLPSSIDLSKEPRALGLPMGDADSVTAIFSIN